jgi:hypothetical protein
MKKSFVILLLAALIMVAAAFIVSILFDAVFPSLKVAYENEQIFRPWNDPWMYVFFLQPFILTGAVMWIWDRIREQFAGSIGRKAMNLTLIYFMVAVIPGMLMSLSTFKVSLLMVLTWTVSSFFQFWLASLVIIKMKK